MPDVSIRTSAISGGTGAPGALPAFGVSPVTGDAIVVVQRSVGGIAEAPTDTAGNTYTQVGSTVAAPFEAVTLSMWLAKNITGGGSFVVTLHGTGTSWSGLARVLKDVDPDPYISGSFASGSDVGLTTATTAEPAGTPPAGSLALGAIATDLKGGTVSPGSGWTAGSTRTTGPDLYGSHRTVSASVAATWSVPVYTVTLSALTIEADFWALATAVGHGFSDLDRIEIAGATPSDYNGLRWAFVINADSFYIGRVDTGVDATGTITASRVGSHVQLVAAFRALNAAGSGASIGRLTVGNIFTPSDNFDVTTGDASEILATTGATVQTGGFPRASKGDILPNGIFALAVESGSTTNLESLSIYTAAGALITAVTSIASPTKSAIAPVFAWSTTHFFILTPPPASGGTQPTLYKIASNGTIDTSWLLPANAAFVDNMAISLDGNTAYYGNSGLNEPIRAYNLAGAAALPNFVNASATVRWHKNFIVRANGDLLVPAGVTGQDEREVRRYSSAGALVATYTLDEQLYEDPEIFTDPDDGYFWARTFPDNDGFTSTFWRWNVSAGTVDRSFTVDTLEGTGDVPSTCPNLLLRGTPVYTGMPKDCPCPCSCDHPTGPLPAGSGSAPGATPPHTDPAWTPECTGGGVFLSAADPVDPEAFDVPVLAKVDTWLELYIARYPASSGTLTLRYAKQPFADAGSFKEGRLVSLGRGRRACTDPDGNYESGRVTAVLSDGDGYIRSLLNEGTPEEYFANREAVYYCATPEGRAAGLQRVRWRGWISDVQLLPNRQVRLEISDVVGSQFHGFNLDKTIGVPITVNEHPRAPEDTLKKIYPIYGGEFSDIGAVAVEAGVSVSAEKGMIPAIDCGDYDISALDTDADPDPAYIAPPVITDVDTVGTTGEEVRYYGATVVTPLGESAMSNIMRADGAAVRNLSHYNSIVGTYDRGDPANPNSVRIWVGFSEDNMVGYLDLNSSDDGVSVWGYADGAHPYPSPTRADVDIIKYASPPTSGAPTNTGMYAWMCLGIGKGYDILDVFGFDFSDQVEPKRVKLDASVLGTSIIRPQDPAWPLPDPFWTKGGVTQFGFFAQGHLLSKHREGVITLAANICGPHDEDDLLIDTAGELQKWFFNEHILKNNGTGYRSGDYGPLEEYANGDSILNTTKFEDAQDTTVEFIGGDGYKMAIAVTEPTTVREIMRQMCLSTGWRYQADRHGRIGPFVISDLADPTLGRSIRDRIEIKRLSDDRMAWDQVVNRFSYAYHFDPDTGGMRAVNLSAEHGQSIAAHVPGGVLGGADRRGLRQQDRDLKYLNDATTATDVIQRELTRRHRRPRFVSPTLDLFAMDYDIADPFLFTHYNGLGEMGDVATPTIALAVEDDMDRDEITYELQDMSSILVVTEGVLLSDGPAEALYSDEDGTTLVLEDA